MPVRVTVTYFFSKFMYLLLLKFWKFCIEISYATTIFALSYAREHPIAYAFTLRLVSTLNVMSIVWSDSHCIWNNK